MINPYSQSLDKGLNLNKSDFSIRIYHTVQSHNYLAFTSGVLCTNSGNGAENYPDPHTHSIYGVLWKLDMRQVDNLTFQNIDQTGLPTTFDIQYTLKSDYSSGDE
ncbi:hypothetical protein L1987_46678 [Smallanthus sonchifolius]|uniref:Uncharacterized protein n=1 Tax=Smallanthus sonchifolius TaxID=185202 RepID=A0ACB9G0A9_9ASTR|nr:hypothetical protein L1987_46678 [Smallanthus sonchifolius]